MNIEGIEAELARQWSKIWKAQERRKRLGKPVTGQYGPNLKTEATPRRSKPKTRRAPATTRR